MKKLLVSIAAIILGLSVIIEPVMAADYVIDSFDSQIELNQNKILEVEEKIEANFLTEKHGIFRIIPYIYTNKGITINGDIRIENVYDERRNSVPFKVEDFKQSIRIKIGDANKTIRGRQVYIIKYQVDNVVLNYEGGPEIYWNITGSEWDTNITKATARIKSPFAEMTEIKCFEGTVGSHESCLISKVDDQTALFEAENINYGKDMTAVIKLSEENKLIETTWVQKAFKKARANWGYLIPGLGLMGMIAMWWKYGRDKKYLSDNVYVKHDSKTEINAPIWAREHLPTVYSPIDGLTPGEVGTILDEKLDLKDIVAEIVELARLGFLRIEKIEEKKFIFKSTDYRLIKLAKDEAGLTKAQKYLLDSLLGDKNEIKITDLKNKFYKHLEPLRKKVMEDLVDKEIFPESPTKTIGKWILITVGLIIGEGIMVVNFYDKTGNIGPVLATAAVAPILFLIASKMARRTAWGHSLYRQIKGLSWYLDKGKWREEIAEKKLFVAETLPLAVALGVVGKMAKDMEVLAMEPPEYMLGTKANLLASDFNNFARSAGSAMAASPGGQSNGWSGHSSWSGGSGFSGGSSGGGFGGGGGGSW